jgi:hypothetical protein
VRDQHRQETTEVELFLNSVKLLANLSRDEKMRLLDALEEHVYPAGSEIIVQVRRIPHTFNQRSNVTVPIVHLIRASWS